MQDEVNEKVIALSIKATELTAEVLQKSMKYVLTQTKMQKTENKFHRGKQTLKQLMEQNAGVSSIEITNENIRAFESIAKKYGVDYALKRDLSGDIPRYIVFFKGRDTDVITSAFREFANKKLKPSVKSELKNSLTVDKTIPDVVKSLNKHRGIEL